jgi:hypothetical protein
MLEIGNGGCTDEEYKSHFSLWSIMKSPLILGMDLTSLTPESAAYKIISNKEVIAVNQDSAGFQARRVWSDKMKTDTDTTSDRLIATKCTDKISNSMSHYQDASEDQQWKLRDDGKIESVSTGQCLFEKQHFGTATSGEGDGVDEGEGEEVSIVGLSDDVDENFGGRAVRIAGCEDATIWEFFAGTISNSIVSKSSGFCLEVSTSEKYPLFDGKRLQTSRCAEIVRIDGATHTHGRDTQEHQSWVLDSRTSSGVGYLKNLYQRQCMTLDRDAPNGGDVEIWQAPLSNGEYAVLVLNLGRTSLSVAAVTTAMLQIKGNQKEITAAKDLWDADNVVSVQDGAIQVRDVESHGVTYLRISVSVSTPL